MFTNQHSVLSRLATFRQLLSTEIPDSLSFSTLSASGFYYPGSGVAVRCQGCENIVELICISTNPTGQEYHKPNCPFSVAETCAITATQSTTVGAGTGASASDQLNILEGEEEEIFSQSSTRADVTKSLLQRENQALKQLMTCKSCNVAHIQDLFLPCGEMYTCKDCSNKFTHCPSCGKRVLGTVTVYFT